MTFADRVCAVPWANFEGSCGASSLRIPDLLVGLASDDGHVALKASKELWNVVCHQHNIASSAVPTMPFLLEVLDHAPEVLAVEIMDMIYGFAATISHSRLRPRNERLDWESRLNEMLMAEVPRLQRLSSHANENIASFAQLSLEACSRNPD